MSNLVFDKCQFGNALIENVLYFFYFIAIKWN